MSALLRIGEVANLLGITTKTVRHYHKIGLLAEPARSAGGYRLYSAADLLRLHRIRKLQSLGLSLGQIKLILGEQGRDEPLRSVLQSLLNEVLAQIEALETRRERIRSLLTETDLDALDRPENLSPTVGMIRERLRGQLGGVSPKALQQQERLVGLLDGFRWPEGYGEAMDALTQFLLDHPEQCRRLLSLDERLVALADAREDSPEVERLARDYARCLNQSAIGQLPTWLSPHTGWMAGPLGDMLSEVVASALTPAQRRCFELIGQYSANPKE